MLNIAVFIQIASGIVTLLLIMAHTPKSEGLGAIGSGVSQFSGVKSGADDKLDQLTWIAASSFLVFSALIGFGFIS